MSDVLSLYLFSQPIGFIAGLAVAIPATIYCVIRVFRLGMNDCRRCNLKGRRP